MGKGTDHQCYGGLDLLCDVAVEEVLWDAQRYAHGINEVYLALGVIDARHDLQCLGPQLSELSLDLNYSLKSALNFFLGSLIDFAPSNIVKLSSQILLSSKICNEPRTILLVLKHQLDFLLYEGLDHGVILQRWLTLLGCS